MMHSPVIAVIGGGRETGPEVLAAAREVGRLIAARGGVLLSGGLGGVMSASCEGAAESGGTVVGVLPGESREAANPHVTVAIATGLGIARNAIIARTADALIAVGGEYGTLSEIAHGLQMGKPVIGIGSWNIRGLQAASTPAEAVDIAFARLGL